MILDKGVRIIGANYSKLVFFIPSLNVPKDKMTLMQQSENDPLASSNDPNFCTSFIDTICHFRDYIDPNYLGPDYNIPDYDVPDYSP